jgi:hypothetical protein
MQECETLHMARVIDCGQRTKFKRGVRFNLKTAKALGLAIPPGATGPRRRGNRIAPGTSGLGTFDMRRPAMLRVLKHRAPSDKAFLFDRKAHKHQHPRQIDPIILSTFASSLSMAGLVPSSGPFMGPLPMPDDERAVPNELVPGAAGLVPKAPPVTDV